MAAPAESLTVPLMFPVAGWAAAVTARMAPNRKAVRSDEVVAMGLEMFIQLASKSVRGKQSFTETWTVVRK
jgi:hypothetical protein